MPLEDRFEISAPIHIGNITTAYPAVQKSLNRKVLLKVLHPQWTDDEEFVERFLREGSIMANLDHPNIVRVYDCGNEDGAMYLALEWIEGGTLAQGIKDGPLSSDEVKGIAADLLLGLSAVHSAGLLHRDIKPDNILISKDGSARLTDFSLAGFDKLSALTGHNSLVGTPAYMAPELVDGSPPSPQSDLYGLGLVLLESLTGVNLYDSNDPLLSLDKIKSTDPPELSGNSNIEPNLASLIDGLLVRDPIDRIRDAQSGLNILNGMDRGISVPSVKKSKTIVWYLLPITAVILFALWIYLPSGTDVLDSDLTSINEVTPERKSTDQSDPQLTQMIERDSSAQLSFNSTGNQKINNATTLSEDHDDTSVIYAKITFTAKPWARVYLKRELLGVTPITDLDLPVGDYLIRFDHEVYPSISRLVEIKDSGSETIMVDLEKENAQLSVYANPWGYLNVDGDSIGLLPRKEPLWLSPGEHALLLTHPQLEPWSERILIEPGTHVNLQVNLNNGTKVATLE